MKKEVKIAIALLIIGAIGYFLYKSYKFSSNPIGMNDTASDSLSIPGIIPESISGEIIYPNKADLSGFDQGDILTFKGHHFTANVDKNKWELIS